MKDWCVYIIRCNDDTLYTGITNDLNTRLKQHNEGKQAAKYTRARRPVSLAYSEITASRSTALKREHAIKQLSRQDKLLLITK
jgi:putative endonuclease